MGEAFLYGNNWSESASKIVTVHVFYRSSVNVTCTNGKKTYTGITDANYNVIFKLLKGIWTITAEKDGYTSSINVNVSEDCTVNMSIFSATINVTYPAGSTCTATDGVIMLTAPDTSGTWACVVPNDGTWTISLDSGLAETVSITENGQTSSINKWYLYNSGDERTDITEGFSGITSNIILKKGTDYMNIYVPSTTGSVQTEYFATNKAINVTKFNTLHAIVSMTNGTNGYASIGIMNARKNSLDAQSYLNVNCSNVEITVPISTITSCYVGGHICGRDDYRAHLYIYSIWLD